MPIVARTVDNGAIPSDIAVAVDETDDGDVQLSKFAYSALGSTELIPADANGLLVNPHTVTEGSDVLAGVRGTPLLAEDTAGDWAVPTLDSARRVNVAAVLAGAGFTIPDVAAEDIFTVSGTTAFDIFASANSSRQGFLLIPWSTIAGNTLYLRWGAGATVALGGFHHVLEGGDFGSNGYPDIFHTFDWTQIPTNRLSGCWVDPSTTPTNSKLLALEW